MRVRDLMKNPVVTAKPDDKPSSLVAIVSSRKIRHFPIVEDGKVVGIVTDSDLRARILRSTTSCWTFWPRWIEDQSERS